MITLLFTLVFSAHAGDLESAFAKRLLAARTPAAARALKRRFDRAYIAGFACRWQNERGLAPIACYRELALEREWRLRPAASLTRLRADLDRRCLLAAERLRVPRAATDLVDVSASCARRVREVREIQAYRRADEVWSGD